MNVGGQTDRGFNMGDETTDLRAIANAHMRRDMEGGGKWSCDCEACSETRKLIGLDKTLEVRALVRHIDHVEQQLDALADGPQRRALVEQYLKLYDELAAVVAK
jgi:hypothetical protein